MIGGQDSLQARISGLFAIDFRSLAAMRCLGALTMIWCLIVWAPDLTALFTDAGVLPRTEFAGRFDFARLSILRIVDGYWATLFVWLVGLIAATCLLIGYRARLAALMCWIVYLSFVGRNPMIIQGGDILLPLILFWMIFLPISAVFSVDAALSPDNRRGQTYLSIATVGLLLQVLYVYVFGALLKTGAVWIPNGSAIYLALHLDTFVTPVGEVLRQYQITMQLLTYFVYWLELLTPLLLFFPDKRMIVRSISLGLLWAMHLGFRIFLHIGHFWLASLTSLCAYIPSGFWRWIGPRNYTSGADRIEIYYDRDCGFCRKVALILREFFLPRDVPVRPAQDTPAIGAVLEREVSWVVIDASGNQRLRWDAVSYVMSQSTLLRPVGWIARLYGAIGLGDMTYKLIGDNRGGFGAVTSRLLQPVRTVPDLGVASRGLLAAIILFCFLWNMAQIYPNSLVQTPLAKQVGYSTGFAQRWTMFAPTPPTRDGYPVLAATTEGGEVLDIFRDPPTPVSFDEATDVLGLFDSARWRAFLIRSWIMDGEDRAYFFGRFAKVRCAAANETRTGADRFQSVTVHYIENETKGGYQEETRRYQVAQVACGGEG